MKVKVLGTAAGGGVPQWNCACTNCTAAQQGRAPSRSVAALAVSADGIRWILVNASSDIGRQIAGTPELRPRRDRASPIVALLLTDANIDHTAGMLEFRQAEAFEIHSTALVKQTLCAAPMFAQFSDENRKWLTFNQAARARVALDSAAGLDVYAIAVPGLLPSYAGAREKEGAAVAYLFEHEEKRLLYAPIFLAVDGNLTQELARADAVLLDGTCWSDDEMIELGLGARTSRAMGHAPIWGAGGSLLATKDVCAGDRYYTHINNSNPILDPASAQAQALRQAGFAVPSDGLEISLDGARMRP